MLPGFLPEPSRRPPGLHVHWFDVPLLIPTRARVIIAREQRDPVHRTMRREAPRDRCREQGLYLAELDAWKRDAIAGLGEPRAASALEARQDRRRVKELDRELHRKDKTLAETAAVLVAHQDLAMFQAGHASSPSWKTAESFF
jgi:hypothetical protein